MKLIVYILDASYISLRIKNIYLLLFIEQYSFICHLFFPPIYYLTNAFIQAIQSYLLDLLLYFKQGVLIQTTSIFYCIYDLVLNYYENSKTLDCSKKK